MVAAPLVDDVHRQTVVEVADVWLSLVVLLCQLQEDRVQCQALAAVEIDVVGDVQFRVRVETDSPGEHLPTERIDALSPCVGKA